MLPAISSCQLGKMYRLNHQLVRTNSFREAITSTFINPLKRLRQLRGTDESMEEFWALTNVSFDVQPGDVVGIIGRNGAGKSTLLKILSRIVEPTEGEIRLRGRVASLLEVGTGFHPELTGRENIYLNGSILGMKKREIDRKFDEIVDFAEVEKFLDTPVKRYSSGMYVRLAFAVAAHLDPEILIVDEVLAVGDAEFQKKCLGKMKEVSTGTGRTVLFVTHNMAALRSLCHSAILLRNGSIVDQGSANEVAENYMRSTGSEQMLSSVNLRQPLRATYWVESVSTYVDDVPSAVMPMGSELTIQFKFQSSTPIRNPKLLLIISAEDASQVCQLSNRFSPEIINPDNLTSAYLTVNLGRVPLCAGTYRLSFHLGDIGAMQQTAQEFMTIRVEPRDVTGSGRIPHPGNGPLWLPAEFSMMAESVDVLNT